MRPIKFRAWDTVKGTLFLNVQNLYDFCDLLRDDRYTFMQFTGLLDKQGKEIYDGDHLRFAYEEDLSAGVFEGTVEWSADGYWQIMIDAHGFSMAIFSDKISEIELLGNIYEHPHLLQEAPRHA